MLSDLNCDENNLDYLREELEREAFGGDPLLNGVQEEKPQSPLQLLFHVRTIQVLFGKRGRIHRGRAIGDGGSKIRACDKRGKKALTNKRSIGTGSAEPGERGRFHARRWRETDRVHQPEYRLHFSRNQSH